MAGSYVRRRAPIRASTDRLQPAPLAFGQRRRPVRSNRGETHAEMGRSGNRSGVARVRRGDGAPVPARPPTVPVQAPPTATYARTVAGVGLVEASSENIAISTPVSGLCTQVYVKVSDRVKAGQKLFSLDDRNLQAELAVRRRALEVA